MALLFVQAPHTETHEAGFGSLSQMGLPALPLYLRPTRRRPPALRHPITRNNCTWGSGGIFSCGYFFAFSSRKAAFSAGSVTWERVTSYKLFPIFRRT